MNQVDPYSVFDGAKKHVCVITGCCWDRNTHEKSFEPVEEKWELDPPRLRNERFSQIIGTILFISPFLIGLWIFS